MKKIFLCAAIAVGIVACNQKSGGYTIEGNISGELENGTQVFLKRIGEDNQPVDIDTTAIENGKFLFVGESVVAPEMRYIFVDKLTGFTPFVLENGEIQIIGQKDSLRMAQIKGTVQNDVFADYMEKSKSISERSMSIQKDMQKASAEKDEASFTSLQDEMNELREEYKDFELGYIKDNPNALISVLLIDRAIASGIVPIEEVQSMYDGLTPEIKESPAAKKLMERFDEMKAKVENGKNTAVGSKAPNFSAPTPESGELALADVKGKLTLIDFWAAWCKPCRAENPNIVNVYNKYHDKGLNVIGVSLDKDGDHWKKAIADDKLAWNHVSNLLYFNDPIAKLYSVDAIPAAFLLDENGVIIAKNLRGPALEAKISELLN